MRTLTLFLTNESTPRMKAELIEYSTDGTLVGKRTVRTFLILPEDPITKWAFDWASKGTIPREADIIR